LFRKFVSGLVIFLAVMRRSDTVGVRGKIVELSGSLVPVVSASPASVVHVSLLCEINWCNRPPASSKFRHIPMRWQSSPELLDWGSSLSILELRSGV
jgi:hypothetical protein